MRKLCAASIYTVAALDGLFPACVRMFRDMYVYEREGEREIQLCRTTLLILTGSC